MSLNNDIKIARKWMYERIDGSTNQVSETFCQGLESFMEFAKKQPLFLENGKLFCPCYKCDNGRLLEEKSVWSHLYNRSFTCNYWVWISHGENYNILNNPENIIASEDASGFDSQTKTVNPYVSMVSDAYADGNQETSFDENMEQEPNAEAKRFYNILDAAKHPIYGTGPTTQPSGSQAAGAQRHVANHEPVENREEVAHVPVQHDVRVLHPARQNGAKWFKNNTEVSTCVRKIIEGCFRGPWYSWKKVPPFYKDAWFSTFQTKFEWDASIENLVKENFDQLAATRLKGMVSLAKSNGEKPDWILSDYWRVMSEYWRTSKAKDKSEKARASRLSRRDGLGVHRHRAGSRSYAKVQDVLEANNEDSSFIAVLKKTHQKSDGTYVDERARLIAEKFDECVQERLSEMENSNGEDLTIDNLTLEEKNEIYSKVRA
ncbi:uncharacterized protein LOC106435483 [Brassica napus]|uniref:uncharacterized protein LOC106435483 n=1 Tax=Brassica napus TaxID=3708 RepID=UPI002079B878|nr:uncharacterized protein LOC106435483 [Brassica napus]